MTLKVSPDWTLVKGHLQITGSVELSSEILSISDDMMDDAFKCGALEYPVDWDNIQDTHPEKIRQREKMANNPNHPSKGIAGKVERAVVWGMGNQTAIAKTLGCTPENVGYYHRKLSQSVASTNRGYHAIDNNDIIRIRKLLLQGNSVNTVAKLTGISTNTIRGLKGQGQIKYPQSRGWADVPNEYLFIKGSDRTGFCQANYYKGRIPKANSVFLNRIIKDKLLPLKCAVTGRYADKRRPHTKLGLYRIDGDITNNQLSNLLLISAQHHPHMPPPRGYLSQPWKVIESVYNRGTSITAIMHQFGMSRGAFDKAVNNGLMTLLDKPTRDHKRLQSEYDWVAIQHAFNAGDSRWAVGNQFGISDSQLDRARELSLVDFEVRRWIRRDAP